jgi:uncharacterized phage-like protein YoqJ
MGHENFYIGVTGHRTIPDDHLIRSKIQEVINNINLSHNSNLTVISPIAEGSDRLVADVILSIDRNKNKLIVVLPLEKEDYMNDFKTNASQGEFLNLLNQADEVITLPETPTRKDAYLQVGKYVTDKCDVLIAIWDGLPSRGKGGTAEIVDYVRSIKKPLYWINSISGEIKYED